MMPQPGAPNPAVSTAAGTEDQLERQSVRSGIRLQVALRALLVCFVLATLLLLPLVSGQPVALVIASCYAVGAASTAVWLLSGSGSALRYGWAVLYLDLIVLTVLGLIAVNSAAISWTSEVLLRGIFVIPVLAATELRPIACASVSIPAAGLYLGISLLTQSDNIEPTASILLRGAVMVSIAVASVALSVIQRSHLQSIGALAEGRRQLLDELGSVEQRERRALAEHLHDGALQYVLAARQDLAEGRRSGDPAEFDRVEEALGRTSQLLRTTVSDLHPAVLGRVGLPAAIRTLATAAEQRGKLAVALDVSGWPDGLRTAADPLLYSVTREMISNVVRHAGAHTMRITVARHDGQLTVTVADDGTGLSSGQLADRLADGHIGLHSQRVRVEAGGGTMTIASGGPGGGTRVGVELPEPDPVHPAATLVPAS